MSHPTISSDSADQVTSGRSAPSAHADTGSADANALSVDRSQPSRQTRRLLLPAWMVSGVFHGVVMLVLALVYIGWQPEFRPERTLQLTANEREEFDPLDELVFAESLMPVDRQSLSSAAVLQIESELPQETLEVRVREQAPASEVSIELNDFVEQTAPGTSLLQAAGAVVGEQLEGRNAEMRGSLLAKYGGTEGSERAVVLALQWFAEHQRPDGSWSFEMRHSPCKGACSQSGRMDRCLTGATAMALLPFLGAGQTHVQGQYQKQVEKGLRFLLRAQDRSGSLVSGAGNLYSHGLAAITLCEAYAMTREQYLKLPAQKALDFISFAQDPVGGGWRYLPKQPGDTSAVAWQLMALKSGHMGNLIVSNRTVLGVNKFLNSVQADGGAMYGYMGPSARPGTTAAGLLCRMYLGWERNHPALQKGVANLAELGPAANEETARYHMYYNYYATQVMRHCGGEAWSAWNEALRDFLVKTQLKTGHRAGSWEIPNWERAAHDTESGGRLYYTSLATMILEVYYRYLPLYSEQAADEFPL